MYTPLFIKTDYSLLSSLIKIDDLITKCKKLNITSIAICDNNLFGTMELIHKCNKENIKPIIGLDLKINEERILLYAKNDIGYYNLVFIESLKNEKEITVEDLKEHSQELICISFKDNKKNQLYKSFYNDFYIGINNKKEEQNAKEQNYETVFINETVYLEDYLYKYLPYIFMIRDGKTINDGIEFTYQHNHLLSYQEVITLCSKRSIDNTIKIANLCNIKLKHELYMPKYNAENSKEFLVKLAEKGLYKRLNNNVNDTYKKRLTYELEIICKMHFEDYFLVVYDYIKYAKKKGILVGPGRGSAAGSLVSYSLGITDVDPMKYNLLFERFLNPERVTMPDIDTDFPDIDRDDVINYVKEKYGEKNTAGIITFGTLASKQAIRDVGRVLNIRNTDIDFLSKKINPKESIKDLKKKDQSVNELIESDNKLRLLYNIVSLIENNKRHTSIHAAGIVISRKPLNEILPIIKSNDMYLTEYTMEYLEELGLIKMDFLGIKNLTIIKNILNDIKENEHKDININDIDLNDSKVIELFAKGDTSGIFQFESEGMRRFLIDLKPKNFDDICNAMAFYRPGPASNIPSYIKRRENKEKIDYIDDRLKDILEPTKGIIVYQEQIMQIANKMAGYSYGEADILRRAMSKKKLEILKNEKEKFINGSIKNGYTKEIAEKVYEYILNFANYGFNKSHSVSYSIVAIRMAYLKCYYKKYFYSNLLNNVIGSVEKTIEYLQELKKMNIKVLPPDINISFDNKYRVIENSIIMPLSSIRNIGGTISSKIIEERDKNKFSDIYDFLRRTYQKTNNIKVLTSLIYSHSLQSFGYNINTLLQNIESMTNYIDLTIDLEENTIEKPIIKHEEELDIDEILEQEKEVFGFYVTSHKTEKYKLNNKEVMDICLLENNLGKIVNIIVNVDRTKEITTKKNEPMCFITGSDNTGSISCTLFPKVYNEYKDIKKNDILKINGTVEKRFDEYQIIVNNIERLK